MTLKAKRAFFVSSLYILLSIILLPFEALSASRVTKLIDYETLTHTISLTKLRAGNHDPSGKNEYYFQVEMTGLIITKEERLKELKDRKKILNIVGDFAHIKINSLSFWSKRDKDKDSIVVTGDSIRKLASDMMRNFSIQEEQVAIKVEIKMFEKEKKFFFLGKDILIGSTSYYPIPETIPHQPNRENIELSIVDKKGTDAIFAISYKSLKDKG